MSSPVKLYVYDLSNGMAKQMSRQLTGRQIDGIWHTSIVVFGKEVFYGHGINITLPGQSHHGAPLQIIDVGETSLDEETFGEYLDEMKEHYTADKYHLLDFNCNSFTNDCAGFLTGGSIPSFIKDLPTDFLSTPFGAALRPTIDAMYRRPPPNSTAPSTPTVPSHNPELAASILQAVASRVQQDSSAVAPSRVSGNGTQSLASPIHLSTNQASFRSLLNTHRVVVAFFTDATCGPCRMIGPIFEKLAEESGAKTSSPASGGAAFVKIDIGIGSARSLADEWNIRVTPTFIFFLDGKKVHEMKGADANGLRTQVDLLLFQAYPPHPHRALSIPTIESLSLNPILFKQVPSLDTVQAKLTSFIDSCSWPETVDQSREEVKSVLSKAIPYLKARFTTANHEKMVASYSASTAVLTAWANVTESLARALPIESLFPLVDMWRLAFLDNAVGEWAASSTTNPISVFLSLSLSSNSSSSPRSFTLTLLRLLSNVFSSPGLSLLLVHPTGFRGKLTSFLVPSLLNEDAGVRSAAAGLMFNIATTVQRGRIGSSLGGEISNASGEDEDWHIELTTVIIEAIDREKTSEEVVHRLTAALSFLLILSPFWESQLAPLLEILQSKQILQRKLVKGGYGEKGVEKKEIRRLIEEVAGKLCP